MSKQSKIRSITNRYEVEIFLHFFTLVTAAGSAWGFHQIFAQIGIPDTMAKIIAGAVGLGVARLMVIRTYYISDLKDTTKLGLFKSWANDFGDPIVGPVRVFGIYGICAMLYAGMMFIADQDKANEQIAQLTIENLKYNREIAADQDSLAEKTMDWYRSRNIMTYGFAPMAKEEIARKTEFAHRNDSLLLASIGAIKTANTVDQFRFLNDLSTWTKIGNSVLLVLLCVMLAMNVDGAVVFFTRVRKDIDTRNNVEAIISSGGNTVGNPVESGNGGGVSSRNAAKGSGVGGFNVSNELEAKIIEELKYQLHKSQRQIARDLDCSHTLVNDINAKYGIRKNDTGS